MSFSSSRGRLGVLGAAAAAALIAIPLTLAAEASVPPPPAGWTQIFADDFTGPAGSGVNTGTWRYTTGTSYPGGPANFGTGEIETMTSSTSNVSLDGAGNLRITPQRSGTAWTSGRIETNREDFQPPANGVLRVEARLQMPNVTGAAARGYWPAFWMLGTPYRGNWWNWPGVGEIDIMENVQGINNEWATMHCGTSPGGPCNEKSGIGGQRACSGTSCQAGFHTYAMEWDRSTNPQQVRFYLDGAQFHQVSANQMDAGTWAAATNHGFFIILNVAMGGEFPAALGGGPDGATAPGHPMVVDYVAAWTRGAGSPPTSPTTPPSTCGPLISRNMLVTASSIESGNQAAAFAVDGDTGTRWSSAHNEPNWLQVDLGAVKPVTRVRLNWEAAYGRAYSIQLSANGSTWTDAYTTYSGVGGIEDIAVTGSARYVRMYGMQRATVYGFSLWEFEIYGACPGSTPPTTGPTTPTSGPTTSQPPGQYPAWAPNTYYAVGTRVSYSGRNYQCLQAHTSIVSWEPPNAASLWQLI
ncbi:Beta-glucanase, GH16 family [Amycolatopsis xylanica]|uniref:Beta-glucanase, GH16 family n=1 Tax=Amycolatopsis xylanica TaxID=589385 RepID=A0A1H3DG40_9PSEU|nr:discoidin domain-containing protein [Amycolatopsis xylanica]SDX65375.1 Beta-glucanase, GH16 family [Amycolatopsis xylanica]